MKKFFSLVAITAVAATMFTSCDGDKPVTPLVTNAKLSLTVDAAVIAAKAEGTFTVTSNINAPEAIVISVKSSDDKILTVDPASVTIAKDTKVITGKYKGVADGKATITIVTNTNNTTISKGSVDVTVGALPAEIAKMVTGDGEGTDGFKYIYAYHEDPEDTSKPEGQRINLTYFDFFEKEGSIVMNLYSENSEDLPMGMGVIKQQGNVGQDGIFLVSVAEGDAVTFDAMVTSPWGYWENVYAPTYKDLATGKDTYIAFACGNGYDTSITLRAWAKINLGTDGSWASFKVIEAYVCLNDGAFKVGQKE